ncbi:hypothetical protein [uncultured Parabacteroides sp.]|jgi:hypothetical protein|uniref:hypothetical protein n=1 Tax=uncultured Parabacteroides sp. TaxID=512312 RepID=UPI002588052F|nr:hypothetical protein [uncultured Parabacteroides sp.]
MTVQDKLKQVAESLGVPFVFEDWTQANVEIDRILLPAVVYVLPASGELDFKNGNIRDNQNGMLAFLDKVELNGNGLDNDCVVDRMKSLAMRFIVKLNETGNFEPLGGVMKYQVAYNKLNAVTSGIVFEVVLKEITGICERNL